MFAKIEGGDGVWLEVRVNVNMRSVWGDAGVVLVSKERMEGERDLRRADSGADTCGMREI